MADGGECGESCKTGDIYSPVLKFLFVAACLKAVRGALCTTHPRDRECSACCHARSIVYPGMNNSSILVF